MAPFCQFFDYFITDASADNKYRFFAPPEGWVADPNLGNWKDATKEAVDQIDGTTVEQRKAKSIQYAGNGPLAGDIWTGQIKIKDP